MKRRLFFELTLAFGLLNFYILDATCTLTRTTSIVNDIKWLDVADLTFSDPYYQVSKPTGLLSIPQKKSHCTAFLISPDIIMTNWHCVPNEEIAQGILFYPKFLQGELKNDYVKTISYSCDEWVTANEELDYVLLRCKDRLGEIYGQVIFSTSLSDLKEGQKIFIVHQNCYHNLDTNCARTKKISFGNILSLEQNDLLYDANTLKGSSGAPVFSIKKFKVVALHHKGHKKWSADGSVTEIDNKGVTILKIVKSLKKLGLFKD